MPQIVSKNKLVVDLELWSGHIHEGKWAVNILGWEPSSIEQFYLQTDSFTTDKTKTLMLKLAMSESISPHTTSELTVYSWHIVNNFILPGTLNEKAIAERYPVKTFLYVSDWPQWMLLAAPISPVLTTSLGRCSRFPPLMYETVP